MNKYVLFTHFLFVFLSITITSGVSADFFNDSLLKKNSEERIDEENHLYTTEEYIPEATEEELFEGFSSDIRPPIDYTKPVITFTDSIDIDKSRVKRIRNIKGLKTDIYRFYKLDEYVKNNLDKDFNTRWMNNRNRMKQWSSEKKGGIKDLDFALPVGKAFSQIVGGETKINIDGSQKITFSGRSEWTEGQIETSYSRNSSFPSLTMKQEPSFNLRGSIGERLSLRIKQDSQMGPFSNLEENISIKYQGKDQDIIKNIDAGNTSLTLKGATFAGYRGSHKGLFGTRLESQIGPVQFTAIASQEKSEANMKSYHGSAEETSNQIRDYEYKSNTYFFIDYIYRERFANARDSFDRIQYLPSDSLIYIEVYIDDGNINNNLIDNALRGEAIPMYMENDTLNPDAAEDGYFHKVDPTDRSNGYYIDRSLGFIQFNRRIPDEWSVGVYIETKGGKKLGSLEYDTDDENSKIQLKLIKCKQQRPTDADTWDLEWKNVYSLGQGNIEPEGLEIRIYRQATDGVSRDTQNGIPYIHIMGLDKKDELGNDTPDNKIDLNRGFINFFRGELIFPVLNPFNPTGPPAGVKEELTDKVPEIYNSQNRREKEEASKYYIDVKTANRTTVIKNLGGMGGIMDGTEQVILNGKPLKRGSDYRVDYLGGEITLLKEEAMSPTADLVIRYEDKSFMQQTQKTLLGMQGEYDLFSDSRIGGVMLFKNEFTKDRRVKLGQEPSRTLLFDTDAQLNFESRLMTSMLDKLPLLVARQPSKIRFEGEMARSMPNMNTRGAVYIDDFEGSHNFPISISRTNWTTASIPDNSSTGGINLISGRLQWYNPWNRTKSSDIWPKKETSAQDNTVHVLNLAYGKPEGVSVGDAFAGVMSSFYGFGIDMSRSRFVEIWARGSKGDLKIDIGSISEDFFPLEQPNGFLDTEDEPIPGQGQGDGILTKDEDTGLDGLFDESEPGYSSTNSDPSNDNFSYKSGSKSDYSRINGTEGNASDGDRLGIPDTEDINHNGILDTRDSYYEYSISFSNPFDPYLVPDSVPPENPNGWRLFRIPLWNNPDAVVGGSTPPDSTLVEFVRMWVTNIDTTTIQIASIEIVENSWLELGILDENNNDISNVVSDRIRVTTANTHENQEYQSPPGVRGEIDHSNNNVRSKEQSLVLKVENLDIGNSAYIYRNFDRMDFTDYTALKMYVHAPETDDFPLAGADNSDIEFIIRFGGDKKNYYEYRSRIYQGWANENKVNVDFSKCTSLKLLPGYENFVAHPDSFPAVADTVGTKIYTLKGKPSLDNIKIIEFGIKSNKSDNLLNCDIWVDELRMDSLRDMTGTAARVNFTTELSDFLNLSVKASQKSSDFHDMNAKKGTGNDNSEWNSQLAVNIEKFTPKRWNLRLPVNMSISDNKSLPRLKSGSDIILLPDQKSEYQSRSSSRKFRFSYSKNRDNSKKGLSGAFINWTFDKIDGSFDWGETDSESPSQGKNATDNMQVKTKYDAGMKKRNVKLFNWLPVLPFDLWENIADSDFSYTPSQLTYDYTYDNRNQYKTNIDGVSDSTKTLTSMENLNFGYNPFKALNYNFTRRKNKDLHIKQEVNFVEMNHIKIEGPKIFNLTNNYDYTVKYDEADNPRYSLSSQLGSKSLKLDKSFSANASFAWNDLIENYSGKPKPPKPPSKRKSRSKEKWENTEKKDGIEKEPVKNDKKIRTPVNQPELRNKKPDLPDILPEPGDKKTDKKDIQPDELNKKIDQKNETEKVSPEKKKQGPSLRTKFMMKISDIVNPITLNYTTREVFQYAGIEDRPDFMIRFGRGAIEPPDSITVVSRNNITTQGESYSANTNFKMPHDIDIRTSGKFSQDEKISLSSSDRSEDTTFPEVNFRWGNVENKIPVLKRLLSRLSLNSTYSLSDAKRWQNESVRPVSDIITRKFSPLVGFSAVIKKVDANFSLTTSTQEKYDMSGLTKSFSITESKNTSTTLRYNLKGIPIFKKMKLKSDIKLNLTFTTQSSETKRRIGEEVLARIANDSSWSFRPSAEYWFSQKFRGGASMEFKNSKDLRNKTRKVREVSIWGQIQF